MNDNRKPLPPRALSDFTRVCREMGMDLDYREEDDSAILDRLARALGWKEPEPVKPPRDDV